MNKLHRCLSLALLELNHSVNLELNMHVPGTLLRARQCAVSNDLPCQSESESEFDSSPMAIVSTQAVVAGLCAALASVFAKFAMSSTEAEKMCLSTADLMQFVSFLQPESSLAWCSMLAYVRIGCFLCIFVFNALMWRFFVKSLQYSSSTFIATVTNTASNFCFTALFGKLLFNEVLSLTWLAGMSLIFIGLILIHNDQSTILLKEQKSKNKIS